MNDLVVRRLLVDLETAIPARWNGGDAFRSALFNALSMSFPVGEQFFMDSVRAGLKALPTSAQEKFAGEVKGFVAQEATHRRIHGLFNRHLENLGYTNALERRAARRIAAAARLDVRIHVASTAAVEHFTAVFASWIFRHPEVFAGAEDRLRTLWVWHASEELEHRSTAFDIFRALEGKHAHRITVFRVVTFNFLSDILRQTVRNLWHDKSLFQLATWRSGWQTLFAKDGLIRGNYPAWRDYLSGDFHPSQHDAQMAEAWLRDNANQFTVVGA